MAKAPSYDFEAQAEAGPYSITLHNTEGGSDKIYVLAIEAAGDAWVVNYANGKRGQTMSTGTKTNSPVSYEEARKVCNKKLVEQVKKGYNPIAGGPGNSLGAASGAVLVVERVNTGLRSQLLVAITEEEREAKITDDAYCAQQKQNGHRRRVRKETDGAYTGANRSGEAAPLTQAIVDNLDTITAATTFAIDGEQIGDRYVVWDVTMIDGVDLEPLPYKERLVRLEALLTGTSVEMSETAVGTEAKRALLDKVRAMNGEGMVYKRLDAPYEPGKASKAKATQFKDKFWADLSAVVTKVNAKRSVSLGLYDDDGKLINVGNVTVPNDQAIPKVGDIVDIRYLYAYPDGSLYQPTLIGVRDDIPVSDCVASQRKFVGELDLIEEEAEAVEEAAEDDALVPAP